MEPEEEVTTQNIKDAQSEEKAKKQKKDDRFFVWPDGNIEGGTEGNQYAPG